MADPCQSFAAFTLPCTTNATLAFTFAGVTFPIRPADLSFLPVDSNDPLGECMSAISAGNIGDANEWLVGDTFLKNVYFATSVKTNSIGLGRLVD